MKTLRTLDSFLNKIEATFLIIFLAIMVVMAFLQVVLRNAFSAGIIWADILLRHLLLWIGFIGAALATSEGRHINIDALRRFLSPKVRSAVDVITDLFAAAMCALLARASVTFLQFEIADKHKVYGDIPTWYAQVIIPVGYGLLVIHFLVRAFLRRSPPLAEESVE